MKEKHEALLEQMYSGRAVPDKVVRAVESAEIFQDRLGAAAFLPQTLVAIVVGAGGRVGQVPAKSEGEGHDG
ncbi:MAG: hypothetical protein JW741_06585 [Sedimentisphaerales bacterium]|nr:hypothetical protein [Sedimentisphaerales bacterium]